MMPGDSRTESIIFRNEARDCDYVNLYLHAVPHDPEGNPLSPALKQAGETEATANAFLAQLILQVRLGGSVLYSGPANAGLEAPVKLGTFRAGDSAEIVVNLSMPKELGNEYSGRLGEIDWVCHAEGFTESQLTARKVWSDGNANHADESITVNLLKDGRVERSQVLNTENGWAYTFDRLLEGHTWTVEEANVPADYTVSYSTVGTMTTITNTRNHTPPTPPTSPLDITVHKVWSSDDGKDRPDSVTVTLYNGDAAYDTVRLGAWNNWSYSWKDLNTYGNWQVIETNIPKGYVPSYHVSEGVVTITNTRSLIQTGQLNWPIWVLGGAGLALVALGGAVLVKKKKHNA